MILEHHPHHSALPPTTGAVRPARLVRLRAAVHGLLLPRRLRVRPLPAHAPALRRGARVGGGDGGAGHGALLRARAPRARAARDSAVLLGPRGAHPHLRHLPGVAPRHRQRHLLERHLPGRGARLALCRPRPVRGLARHLVHRRRRLRRARPLLGTLYQGTAAPRGGGGGDGGQWRWWRRRGARLAPCAGAARGFGAASSGGGGGASLQWLRHRRMVRPLLPHVLPCAHAPVRGAQRRHRGGRRHARNRHGRRAQRSADERRQGPHGGLRARGGLAPRHPVLGGSDAGAPRRAGSLRRATPATTCHAPPRPTTPLPHPTRPH